MVLEDRFAPVTSSIGFLRASLHDVAEALRRWRFDIHGASSVDCLDGGLTDNVRRLEPLTGGVRPRELLVATGNPEWTALFDCGIQGGDQTTTVGYLSRTMLVQGVVVVSIPDVPPTAGKVERFGARQFEMFGPVATDFLNYVRTISVVRDGPRWRFDANGTMQDFEDGEAYKRRKVADRLTSSMLSQYAAALGLSPFDVDFYSGPSALVSNSASPPAGALVLPISEARQRLGIAAQG